VEALELLQTPRGDADLAFEAGASGPGPSHETQLAQILTELDPLTADAAPIIDAKLGGWLERSLADDPWTELEWRGGRLTGRSGQFQLHYSCASRPDAMISVSFEAAKPVAVQIDD